MVFSSLEFIYLFMPPVLIGFFILRSLKLETAIIWWLIAASVGFYAWWSPPHLALLIGSIVLNYGMHLALVKWRHKAFLVGGIIFNLLLLGLFKYADFFIGNFNALTGLNSPALNLVLPLAISFYTFQQISFLRDSWRGELVDCDFKKYVLFVTFFPQLIAGPIVMQKDTIPQFKLSIMNHRPLLNLLLGSTLFFIGLFKKIVFADGLAPYANSVFQIADQGMMVAPQAAWAGSLAYTLQIYFDFSGYCDMALGLALMFGIRLPINFNSPYRSLNIVEFWRRWHITLSRFLRDYLYIPLGGNRHGILGAKGNLMLTMLLGGLWHGAGWNFIIWGALHGTYLVINHAWISSAIRNQMRAKTPQLIYNVLAWSLTMLLVIVAWVFFRAETFSGAMIVLQAMFLVSADSAVAQMPTLMGNPFWLYAAFAGLFGLCALFPNSLEITRKYKPVLASLTEISAPRYFARTLLWRPSFAWGLSFLFIGAAGIIQIYRLNGLTEFIYFNF